MGHLNKEYVTYCKYCDAIYRQNREEEICQKLQKQV